MAKFIFSMASLLRVRERIEEQKKQEFGEAILALEKEREKLKELQDKKNLSISIFKKNVEEHIDAKATIMANRFIDLMKKRIEAQLVVVKIAEEFAEQKRVELMNATIEKKKLEKLKEKKYEDYLIDEKRSEQNITDEVVSYRYHE